jgi:Na+-driven multidrug efflux pump
VKDLTEHSIGGHIVQMAVPIAAGMLFQTLYFLIDLYFVAHLGDAALAVPAVVSSATRILSFAVPALWLTTQSGFQLVQLWYVSVASMTLQACVSLALMRHQFRLRLVEHEKCN